MRALIASQINDVHANAVASALSQHGHEVLVWAWPGRPSEQAVSLFMDERGGSWQLGKRRFAFDHFDVIWHRRRHLPKLQDSVHPDDLKFASSENAAFWPNLFTCADPRTRWVHRPEFASRGENKLLQLVVARRAGFRIPDSLMSNDSEEIAGYIERIESHDDQAIYKTFSPAAWRSDQTIRIKHTTLINSEQVLANKNVSSVPGIYQARIAKSYEVRITMFGAVAFAVRINSQMKREWRLDWRAAIDLRGVLEPIDVPVSVLDRCSKVLSDLGLSMGCFDFIVDLDGDYWFLEVNQQGQFLWIEQALPELRLLQGMSQFLIGAGNGNADTITDVKFADIQSSETYRTLERSKSWPVLLQGHADMSDAAAAERGLELAV